MAGIVDQANVGLPPTNLAARAQQTFAALVHTLAKMRTHRQVLLSSARGERRRGDTVKYE